MRYAHTSIVATDWQTLAVFYVSVLGCTVKPPQRSLAGEWLARGTGVQGAALEGVHLLLPGYDRDGPTLEIYTYAETVEQAPGPANRRGLAHIAFAVEDVERAVRRLLDGGGTLEGEITTHPVEGVGEITYVYARDPEGNLIELQSWRHEKGRGEP